MEKVRILCYGDSNTWGYISGTNYERYDENIRWPKVLAKKLGDKFEIIEEGLSGRTLISDDIRPGKEGRNGYKYLIPCLNSHDPIDLVVLMLGTNELKTMFDKTANEVGEIFEEYFVRTIIGKKSQFKDIYPKLLIVIPPRVNEDNEFSRRDKKYLGGEKKSIELEKIYIKIAKKYNCYYLTNEGLETGVDGLHLTKKGHYHLAEELTKKINDIYNK